MRIGLTLPNRGILFGATTVDTMLQLAENADRTGLFDAVWVGDSMLGKPRLESIALLAAVAGRTRNVRLGTACMASFPLRDPVLLAYQWASLDVISSGRTILIACTGLVEQEGAQVEASLYGLTNAQRVTRLIEWIQILRLLWSTDNASFDGREYRFKGVSIDPKPVQKPVPPIWIANNAPAENRGLVERTHRRAVTHGDGWQTSIWDPEDLEWRVKDMIEKVKEAGKDPDTFDRSVYHNININEDEEAAVEESRKFLELYYVPMEFSDKDVRDWVAIGSPDKCIQHIKRLESMGVTEVGLRITSWDQMGQFKRLVEEVLPALQPARTKSA
jgi:alkanesulfonate monooxygenase SsuD/methylene tetrahydromethanopterin reductase-like flavin-dependent oxidoreductase (luciferase family)